VKMKLPNGERAFVDMAKLRDYSLDPAHKEGRHKARVFAAALGLTRNDVDYVVIRRWRLSNIWGKFVFNSIAR